MGDPSETDMPDQRSIGDLYMLHRRPTSSGDQHARGVQSGFEFKHINVYLNILIFIYMLFAYLYILE